MVKFYTTNYSYDYSLPAVTLAYFLRYPNPYSTHVLSTDVIERSYDAETQRVTTTRLHLKRSKLPAAVLKLLPRSLMGGSDTGDSQSFILERSTVDMKEGWMTTESRNLEWTGVLSVVESQVYRDTTSALQPPVSGSGISRVDSGFDLDLPGHAVEKETAEAEGKTKQRTSVVTTVALRSHIGENLRRRRARMTASTASAADDTPKEKQGFFRSWTTGSIQRSIELIGLRRAEGAQPKAKQGMQVVLERLRRGGLVGVLEGMRRDRELMFASGSDGPPSPAGGERAE